MVLPSIRQCSSNVHEVRYLLDTTTPVQQIFASDWHVDSKDTDKNDLKKILDYCLENSVIIHHFGDLFDAMQGKNDKRGSKAKLLSEIKGEAYWSELVDYMVEFFKPYASVLGVFGYGNHETAVINRNEIDLLLTFVKRLQTEHNSTIQLGGYSGYIVNRFKAYGGRITVSSKIWYRHSGGSLGTVTKGTLATDRMELMAEADIYVSGDNHENWMITTRRLDLTNDNNIVQRDVLHIKTPTMKNEFKQGINGWVVEKNMRPRPLGVWKMEYSFLRRILNKKTSSSSLIVKCTPTFWSF